MRFSVATFVIILAGTVAKAELVPPRDCAVVVASRQDMTEANEFIAENPALKIRRIYRAANGWLALSTGNIRVQGSDVEINRLKSHGQLPLDAYCSRGRTYQSIVWSDGGDEKNDSYYRYATLFDDINPYQLSRDDKRFLQAALAFEGQYSGLLDGDWGPLSRKAMSRWSLEQFGTASENWHMAVLAYSLFKRKEADGWQQRFFPGLEMSFLVPESTLQRAADSENFLNYRHANSSLSVSVGVLSSSTALSVHEYTLGTHALTSPAYTVRKDELAVSSATLAGGGILYTRSNYVDGLWSTVMLSASRSDKNLLNAITSSIAVGRTSPLRFTSNGKLDVVIFETVALLEENEKDQPEFQAGKAVEEPRDAENDGKGGTGSGFFVSEAGHVMTNAHVVDGCETITVDGLPATLVDSSKEFDLALLHVPSANVTSVADFATTPAGLNADVTAVGYPYNGLLGGLNVTRGSVSASKGLAGDATRMQITAPVQSGNSGGPLLASNGSVVGVVVSKLDALEIADATGDLPQNVNFAVRGEIAKLFLAQNGLVPKSNVHSSAIEPEVLAKTASVFTTFVRCD